MMQGGKAQDAHAPETCAIADDNSKATCIFISGATGPNAQHINGHYSPTQERGLDGRILYRKEDCHKQDCDDSICIEHLSHTEGVWQVKRLSCKGTDECYAVLQSACALEACTSCVWWVGIAGEWHEHPSVKMVSGGEAKRAVSYSDIQIKSPTLLECPCFYMTMPFFAGCHACCR